MRPFDEAWMNTKGEVFSDGVSHFDIAQKRIKEVEPAVWNSDLGDTYDTDWYDFCYEWMWKNGYARLVGMWNGTVVIQTSAKYPDFRPTLLRKAKAYCKKTDGVTALECDNGGRVIWKLDDTL